tara:strand:+ start:314 stop:1027 length:714 start_codon:yes stop_codon:yes gene_type:complete
MINVDAVYQTVQALANKEQRGYLTPQEFNLFANQAQDDIFHQYIYDLAAFNQAKPTQKILGDSVKITLDKLIRTTGISYTDTALVNNCTTLPTGGLYTGRIFIQSAGGLRRTLIEMDPNEIQDLIASPWHAAAFTEPVFFDDGHYRIQVWNGSGQISSGCTCEQITGSMQPVIWNYVVVNEKPVYNATNSKDFSLDQSEQADLVAKILKLAGISIEDQQLYQAGMAEENLSIQQENK